MNCDECRKKAYCRKPCKAKKEAEKRNIREATNDILAKCRIPGPVIREVNEVLNMMLNI